VLDVCGDKSNAVSLILCDMRKRASHTSR
jgi:hypothetical protein